MTVPVKILQKICIGSLICVSLLSPSLIQADNFTTAYDDKLLKTQFSSFVKPKKLIISPVTFLYQSADKLAQSIYFYFVDKIGFPQSPVQYAVDQNGLVNKLINIDEDFTDNIVVAVDSRILTLTQNQIDAIFTLVDKYDIAKENILLKSFKLSGDKKSLEFFDPKERNQLDIAINSLQSKSLSAKQMKVTNVSLDFPQTVDPEKIIDVTLKFKNISGFSIYKDSVKKVLVKTIAKESQLFVNGEWFTKNEMGELQEGRVRDGEEGTIKFKALTPLVKGSFIEDLQVVDSSNRSLSNVIRITASVKDVGQKVLIVKDTGYGFLNVRDRPISNAAIIATVNPGDKFVYSDKQNNYYKIHIVSKNIDGWVPSSFVKEL